MVCPKCGHNGPEGLECSACGVIFDKFRRSGGAQGQAPREMSGMGQGQALPMPSLPKSRIQERKRPIGQSVLRGVALVIVLGGLGGLLDFMRLELLSGKIAACIKAATAGRVWKGRHLDEAAVLLLMRAAARERSYELPEDRIWSRIRPKNTNAGVVVELLVKMHVPTRLMGFIKREILLEGSTAVLLNTVRGYTAHETSPSEPISKDLKDRGKL